MTKTCKNCQASFIIEPDDLVFYEKMKVPSPTWCPECRTRRRFAWRNERSLHKRKCDAPGHSEELISMYSPGAGRVYDYQFWWSDGWDPMVYGRNYDPSKSFFKQFAELRNEVPLPNLSVVNSVNSDYCNWTEFNKNCYLAFAAGLNENVRFANKALSCLDSQDLLFAGYDELGHELVNCFKCNRLLYSLNCRSCTDSAFLFDCRNCSNCFMCSNLVGKSYCINNQQYSKEEYKKKMAEVDLGSHLAVQQLRKEFLEIVGSAIHRYANIVGSNNCSGNDIINSKNCSDCFEIYEELEDGRFLISALKSKGVYDSTGQYKVENGYENVDTNESNNIIATITTYTSHDVRYCISCHSSKNLFGCVGLRSKEYCILNKQYSKEEYEQITAKIIASMGDEYGSFFPMELSPFDYQETIAQEYFPKEIKKTELRDYQITKKATDLADNIKDVGEDILKEVIRCEHAASCNEQCTTAFKIIPPELQFYQRLNLPLPRLCPNCRHYTRLKQRNPLKLWKRQCSKCGKDIETSYAPERKENVYCESCYQREVM
ncbi:MAG: hypothetical protein AAB420_03460 [Patescibacteria group bacterium]